MADLERPIGFNPRSRVPDDLKPIVTDGVVAAFRNVWPAFLRALEDPALKSAARIIPPSVPSGLPVAAVPAVPVQAK